MFCKPAIDGRYGAVYLSAASISGNVTILLLGILLAAKVGLWTALRDGIGMHGVKFLPTGWDNGFPLIFLL